MAVQFNGTVGVSGTDRFYRSPKKRRARGRKFWVSLIRRLSRGGNVLELRGRGVNEILFFAIAGEKDSWRSSVALGLCCRILSDRTAGESRNLPFKEINRGVWDTLLGTSQTRDGG